MEDKLLDVQIRENYTRDVFIRVEVSQDREQEFNEVLDQFEDGYKNYRW